MKKIKVLLFSLTIVFLCFPKTFAQNKKVIKADETFQNCHYYDAIELYKTAYAKDDDNTEKAHIIFQTAQCYRLINDYKKAEAWFKKAIEVNYPDPIATLYYADMLLANGNLINGKIDEAVKNYNIYKNLEPSDPRGVKGIETCKLALQWLDAPTSIELQNCFMINSKNDDFAPFFYDKKFNSIIFSSSREGSAGKNYNPATGQQFADLYVAVLDKKGSWYVPSPIGSNINTISDEYSACLNLKGSDIYLTRSYIEKNKKAVSHIFISKKEGETWGLPVLIPIAADSIDCCNPNISKDELTLFFSSDIPGGYGGMDIWMIHRINKAKPWGKPVNLGPVINTPGDEVYPYIRENNTLYFSSNGLPGMGGMDIFKAEKKGDSWGTPVNMQYPINSTSDDLGIIFKANLEEGYFSSNRPGGKGGYDLYSFFSPQLSVTDKNVSSKAADTMMDSSKTQTKGFDIFMQNGSNQEKFENFSFEQLKKKASDEKKLILIDCYATWCVTCKKMDAEIFSQPAVAEFCNGHFVCAKADIEKEEGITLAKKYHIESVPTYLFFDSTGSLIYHDEGYMEAEKFINHGKNITVLNTIPCTEKQLNGFERILYDGIDSTQKELLKYKDEKIECCQWNMKKILIAYLNNILNSDSLKKKYCKEFIIYFTNERDTSDEYIANTWDFKCGWGMNWGFDHTDCEKYLGIINKQNNLVPGNIKK